MGLFKKKDPIVEVEKALDHEVHEMEHDIQADVDAVMKKYDMHRLTIRPPFLKTGAISSTTLTRA